jgi:sulfur transfer complex TusBCD TusB component (DsrH family)
MDDEATYLGDGVYASFDGYSVWLAVNHHENNVVALEAEVLARLFEYVENLKEKKNAVL